MTVQWYDLSLTLTKSFWQIYFSFLTEARTIHCLPQETRQTFLSVFWFWWSPMSPLGGIVKALTIFDIYIFFPILGMTDLETGPMCCLIMSEQVSLSPSLITLMKLTAAQWEVCKVLPAASMKYTFSAACNITKQADKRSFWAAKVVYMLIMQPHCSLHRMFFVCLSQFGFNESLHWLSVC